MTGQAAATGVWWPARPQSPGRATAPGPGAGSARGPGTTARAAGHLPASASSPWRDRGVLAQGPGRDCGGRGEGWPQAGRKGASGCWDNSPILGASTGWAVACWARVHGAATPVCSEQDELLHLPKGEGPVSADPGASGPELRLPRRGVGVGGAGEKWGERAQPPHVPHGPHSATKGTRRPSLLRGDQPSCRARSRTRAATRSAPCVRNVQSSEAGGGRPVGGGQRVRGVTQLFKSLSERVPPQGGQRQATRMARSSLPPGAGGDV